MITIQNLSFSYGSKGVLKNISIKTGKGKGISAAIILACLAVLGYKYTRATGTIDTDGRTPFDREPSLLAEQFYLPDEVAPVRNKANQFGVETGALWPKYDHGKFLTLLREFEVDEQQIAFSLACNARHYFLDEPTNGLDIPSKSQFRKAITKYTADDSCVVISTHQVRDLEEIIDPIVILDKEDVLLNASLQTISEKLFFDYGTEIHPEALYLERTPSGAIQVYPNTTGEESKVNLEALFNAVHAHKDVVKALFQ